MEKGTIESWCMIVLMIILLQLQITVSDSHHDHDHDHHDELSYNYYQSTCPFVEDIVRKEVMSISAVDPTAPAAFLRLLFHDCQVQGCDASILLNSMNSELHSSKNFGIRKLEEIDRIKSVLEFACPRQVSCADIIALAARDAIALSFGPSIEIPLGRKDTTTSSSLQADDNLPSPSINVDQLLHIFMAKGMDLEETVAILGAHTLGAGHCINIVDRLYNPNPSDQMNPGFELELRLICPTKNPITNLSVVSNDITPTIFDNQYYRDGAMGKGLFFVDSSLSRDTRTMTIASQYAVDKEYFFQVFSSAFIKLSSANVLTGNMGQVRSQCNQVN